MEEKPDFATRAANKDVLLNNRPQYVRSVRVVERLTIIPIKPKNDKDGKPYKGYKPDKNEFADVWQMRDGNWKIEVVHTFDANQPDFQMKRPVTSRGKYKGKPDPAAKWLMRLRINDMGTLGEGEECRIVHVRKINADSVVLDDHSEANVDKRERDKKITRNAGHSATKLRDEKFRKVVVDEIGRVQKLKFGAR